MLALLLALLAMVSCAAEPAPPSGGGEAGSQVSSSLDSPSSLRDTTTPSTSPFIAGKPCELLSPDEVKTLGLQPPGPATRTPDGNTCNWNGADYSVMIVINSGRTFAQVEASRPGRRTKVAGRAASMAQGEGAFAGLCEVALDVTRIAAAVVVLSRFDDDSAVACVNVIKVAAFVHPRLPGG